MEEEKKPIRVEGESTINQLPQAVAALLKEDIQGIEEEIVGLRRLGRRLLER